ncbi:MAG: hypothetical protein E7378_02710 [Clostridiales bacterium]|nr:hypothetical protein [Clostridiales bacterium]
MFVEKLNKVDLKRFYVYYLCSNIKFSLEEYNDIEIKILRQEPNLIDFMIDRQLFKGCDVSLSWNGQLLCGPWRDFLADNFGHKEYIDGINSMLQKYNDGVSK